MFPFEDSENPATRGLARGSKRLIAEEIDSDLDFYGNTAIYGSTDFTEIQMVRSIEISEATFERLQAIATPFVDTPGTVIDRLLDRYQGGDLAQDQTQQSGSMPLSASKSRSFLPHQAPDLTHTKLLKASLGGKELTPAKWNELVRKAHEIAFLRFQDFDALRQITTANLVKGDKNGEGYKPLGRFGFSIQGVDANVAWRISYGIAKKLGLPIEVWFEWREREGAYLPGAVGILRWPLEDSPSFTTEPPQEASEATWRDDVVRALQELGGHESLNRIYQHVERIRKNAGRSTPPSFEAVVRQTLEFHSSDSDAYGGGQDLFSMAEGKGAGVWALR